MILKNICIVCVVSLLVACTNENKQDAKLYQERAENLCELVYDSYYQEDRNLFSEYFPNSYKENLTYFQGEKQETKVVSYLWPMSGIYSSLNILASIDMENEEDRYIERLYNMYNSSELYLDTTRLPHGYQAYPSIYETVDRYYDDNGLVGIDYVESYNITGDSVFITKAKDVFTFILSGWDDVLGGGITWLEGHRDQKPACSNGKATVLALKLYLATEDEYYLMWGKRFYNWMYDNLRDEQGIYWNDVKTIDAKVNKVAWTYNTGTMLQSAMMLYNITKDFSYLYEAQFLAEGSYSFFVKQQEDGQEIIVSQLPWFVVVLLRGYEMLYYEDQNYKYVDGVINMANYAWDNARDDNGLFYKDWSGRTDEATKPKWLLDEACMIELYARAACIKRYASRL
ncbi:MAG: glycosyl hydrolase family 76 [Bacteroidales bacterium]|jgi:uncharacterized protein YyaL (SSP411 family)|nr:glycosyl hydrolase family 76 [Bacteroidales bacterium]